MSSEQKIEPQRKIVNGKTFVLVESTKKSKYRKAKWLPEDYDQIDKWKMPKIEKKDIKGSFSEESSFVIMFPRYRETYLKECWTIVLKSLKENGIKVNL